MRTHGRKRRILLHDSDFRGKFRIVQHFSCRNAVFPPIPYPPKPVFSALFCNYGGARCSTIPKKQPRNGIVRHLGTQNVSKRPEACNHRKKNASKADSPFFPYILMRFIREEPRVPETSPISMKLVMFCWAISTQSSTTQLPSNCSGSDCST